MRQTSGILLIVIASLVAAGCASPPPKAMTHEQYLAQRASLIAKAVQSAIMAGEDGTVVQQRLELQACYDDAMALVDTAQRPAAVQQCSIAWPQTQVVTLNCYNQNSVTQSSSR
jgi:hypothetical protein